jgi:hypothetical protein
MTSAHTYGDVKLSQNTAFRQAQEKKASVRGYQAVRTGVTVKLSTGVVNACVRVRIGHSMRGGTNSLLRHLFICCSSAMRSVGAENHKREGRWFRVQISQRLEISIARWIEDHHLLRLQRQKEPSSPETVGLHSRARPYPTQIGLHHKEEPKNVASTVFPTSCSS